MLGWMTFCVTSSAPFQQPEDVALDGFGTNFLVQRGGGSMSYHSGEFQIRHCPVCALIISNIYEICCSGCFRSFSIYYFAEVAIEAGCGTKQL